MPENKIHKPAYLILKLSLKWSMSFFQTFGFIFQIRRICRYFSRNKVEKVIKNRGTTRFWVQQANVSVNWHKSLNTPIDQNSTPRCFVFRSHSVTMCLPYFLIDNGINPCTLRNGLINIFITSFSNFRVIIYL